MNLYSLVLHIPKILSIDNDYMVFLFNAKPPFKHQSSTVPDLIDNFNQTIFGHC